MENHRRVHVFISGRVQGVFFRMETQRAAQRIGVFGWVKNRQDSRVEAVIEGPSDKVAQMVQWCRKGPAMAHVTDLELQEEAYGREFTDFKVVY